MIVDTVSVAAFADGGGWTIDAIIRAACGIGLVIDTYVVS